MNCLACESTIDRMERLSCTKCKGCYHYQCLNMTSAFFRQQERRLKASWICPSCELITRRCRNDNTPASPAGMQNETQRIEDVSMNSESDISNILGDTAPLCTPPQRQVQKIYENVPGGDSISFDRFSHLIKTEFETMKEALTVSITTNIKQALFSELNTQINKLKEDFSNNSSMLAKTQQNLHHDINSVNEKIQLLESENEKLSAKLAAITEQLESKKHVLPTETHHNKKIVLYGLNEYPNENEYILIERITNFFYEVYGTDVNGFIEDVCRIGKHGYRRPVEINFISKRMRNYILHNKRNLRNTGLAVAEFMTTAALQNRRILKDTLKDARKHGLHPIIRREKVFVNGIEYRLPQPASPKQDQPAKAVLKSPAASTSVPNLSPAADPNSITLTNEKENHRKEISTFRA